MESHSSREMFQILNAIKELIKTKSFREEGFEKLKSIDVEELLPQQQIFYYYIKAKFYMLSYREAEVKDITLLEYADDFYTDMVTVAFKNEIRIKSPKNHFARAYCKYLLAQEHSNQQIREKLLAKVKQIVTTALRISPDNDSFMWLQSQL